MTIEILENHDRKTMFKDGFCMGIMDKNGEPKSAYMKPIMERINGLHSGSNILFLGGGLCILPSWAQSKGHFSCTIENDPEILQKVPQAGSFILGDASVVIGELEEDWFDFILLDVYPNHPNMYCADYYTKCKKHLKEKGTLAINYCENVTEESILKMNKELIPVFSNVNYCLFKTEKNKVTTLQQIVYFCN